MDVKIKQLCCCNCGIVFWVTLSHYGYLRDGHNTFYCPSGHGNYFHGQTEAEKQKERAEKAEHQAERLNNELKRQIDKTEAITRSNRSLRGVITRKKKSKKTRKESVNGKGHKQSG